MESASLQSPQDAQKNVQRPETEMVYGAAGATQTLLQASICRGFDGHV